MVPENFEAEELTENVHINNNVLPLLFLIFRAKREIIVDIHVAKKITPTETEMHMITMRLGDR